MEKLELICFKIISAVGMAKSSYIEAIKYAKHRNFEKAIESLEEGKKEFMEGHKAHAELIQMETSGGVQPNLLLMHAEDQMMSAETCKILAEEFIASYENMATLEKLIRSGDEK